MIGHLEGTVHSTHAGFLILSVAGVGYKVATTRETLASLKNEKTAALWTHLAVREDALDLYGFRTEEKTQLLHAAVQQEQRLSIIYLKGKDEKSTRVILPRSIGRELYNGKEFTAVRAWCDMRQDERVFNLERILKIETCSP